MSRSRIVLLAAFAGAGAALALSAAAATPTEDRQATMKLVGQQMKDSAAFTSPRTPFDPVKVKALMAVVAASGKKLHGLYPAASAKDPKTSALPVVWTNKSDFDKRLNELSKLATEAGKATSTETFKPAFFALGQTCKSCHDVYRKTPS